MPPEPQEINELYERYAHVIFLRAKSILHNDEAAHDAVQETFAKVIVNWEKFRGESSPLTWMYRINTNLCLNRLRNQKGHQKKHEDHREDIAGTDRSFLKVGIDAQRIRSLIAEADPETQAIVTHIYFDEMTREETAQMVGLSVPTVRKRLNQFLKRARKHLGLVASLLLLVLP